MRVCVLMCEILVLHEERRLIRADASCNLNGGFIAGTALGLLNANGNGGLLGGLLGGGYLNAQTGMALT